MHRLPRRGSSGHAMTADLRLDLAESAIADLIEVHLMVIAERLDDPGAFPGYTIEPDLAAVARRIIARLLDDGWTMPESLP
jgi:hypothetical protein